MAYEDFKTELTRLSTLIKRCQSLQLPNHAQLDFMERHLSLQFDVLKQYEHPFNDEQKHRLEISLKANISFVHERLLDILKKHATLNDLFDEQDQSPEALIERLRTLLLPKPSPKTPRTRARGRTVSLIESTPTADDFVHPFSDEGVYYSELQSFRKDLSATQESIEKLPEGNPFINDDPILQPLYKTYKRYKESIEQPAAEFEKELKLDLAHPGYFGTEALLQKMRRLQALLPKKRQHIYDCFQKICARINLICPDKPSNLLVSKALTQLQTCIISHLKQFCEIRIHQQIDKDTLYFNQKLHDFINILEKTLQHKELDLDKSQTASLKTKLKMHIGLRKNYLLSSTTVIEPLPEGDIIPLTNGLFKETHFSTTNQQKVIARAYQAIEYIRLTEFHHTKAFFDNKREQIQLADKINTLKTTINGHLSIDIEALKHHALLMNRHQSLYTEELRRQLIALEDYQERAQALNPTNLAHEYTDESLSQRLARVSKDTESYRKTHEEIAHLHDLVINNHRLVELLYTNITQEYKEYRYRYQQQALTHQSKITRLNDSIRTIQTYPNHAEKLSQLLEHFNHSELAEPLERYQSQEQDNEDYLNLVSKDCYSKLHGQLNDIIHRAAQHIFTYSQPKSSAENHIIFDLNKTISSINTTYENMQKLRSEIKPELQDLLVDKSRELSQLTGRMERELYHRTVLHQKAIHVQWRIDTKSFEVASEVVEKLNQRFIKLVEDAIRAGRRPSPPLLNNLLNNHAYLNSRIQPLTHEENAALNNLDSRLSTLYTVRATIDQARNTFIHEIPFDRDGHVSDVLQKTAEQAFITELQSASRSYLHHQHLYNLSDSEQYKFIQWLRRHVFKPIQHIGHYASSKEYRHNPANRFFVPVLASETERECAALGIKLIGVTPTA